MSQTEKERYGQSRMVRYITGIDQPIYPIAFVKNKVPMAKRSAVCSYTAEGRALIHTNLTLNMSIMGELREQDSHGHSTEYMDCRLSLFSAQHGKCAVCGEEFANVSEIVCWLKKSKETGGEERYQNMVLIHERYIPLLQDTFQNKLKVECQTIKITAKELKKVNNLREQAELPAIEK